MPATIDWMQEVGPRLDEALKPPPWEECQTFAGGLNCSLRQLHVIRDLDARWRANVQAGRDRYDPAVASRILDRFRRWLESARKQAVEFEKNGCDGCYQSLADQFKGDLEDIEDLVEQRELREAGQAAMARFHREEDD